jgi:hypothetical protein
MRKIDLLSSYVLTPSHRRLMARCDEVLLWSQFSLQPSGLGAKKTGRAVVAAETGPRPPRDVRTAMNVPHDGHAAGWEFVANERVLRIKQFRQVDGEIVAAYLHLEVDDEGAAQRIAEPIVAILNDPNKISGMCEVRDGGILYVRRPAKAKEKP